MDESFGVIHFNSPHIEVVLEHSFVGCQFGNVIKGSGIGPHLSFDFQSEH
jgi:hypothetical protein